MDGHRSTMRVLHRHTHTHAHTKTFRRTVNGRHLWFVNEIRGQISEDSEMSSEVRNVLARLVFLGGNQCWSPRGQVLVLEDPRGQF